MLKDENDSSKEKSELETKLEHIQTSENDENTVQVQLEQIEMLKFQMREKAELVKASTSDENLKIKVEDLSEAIELKGKEVEDLGQTPENIKIFLQA